jgi:hypothetical protein
MLNRMLGSLIVSAINSPLAIVKVAPDRPPGIDAWKTPPWKLSRLAGITIAGFR